MNKIVIGLLFYSGNAALIIAAFLLHAILGWVVLGVILIALSMAWYRSLPEDEKVRKP